MKLIRIPTIILAASLFAITVRAAAAQSAADFPSRPVKIIVPFAAGGPTDVITRILAEMLTARWKGQAVVVEDRPGAGTIIATSVIAKSPPDGYTIGMATNSFLINPAIGQKLPYDTIKDLVGISMVATQPMALVANASFPANTIPEVVALAKKAKEPLNYTSPGPRGAGHFAGEMLKQRAGINMTHISYNGSTPALTDVMAGRVPLMFDVWHSARRFVGSGKLKLIAGTTTERLPDQPDKPTIADTYPGFNVVAFQALIGPVGIPEPILNKLSSDTAAVIDSKEFAERTKALGIKPYGTTSAELDTWMRKEIANWKTIADAAHIKVE
jgi:tripartite-type tricarboxylate transporter receptor subunit TctC